MRWEAGAMGRGRITSILAAAVCLSQILLGKNLTTEARRHGVGGVGVRETGSKVFLRASVARLLAGAAVQVGPFQGPS